MKRHEARTKLAESSVSDTNRMRNAHFWAEELIGYIKQGPNAGLSDFYVEIRGGKPVLVLGDSWNDSKIRALTSGLEDWGFPSLAARSLDDETRVFVEPSNYRPTYSLADDLNICPRFL